MSLRCSFFYKLNKNLRKKQNGDVKLRKQNMKNYSNRRIKIKITQIIDKIMNEYYDAITKTKENQKIYVNFKEQNGGKRNGKN